MPPRPNGPRLSMKESLQQLDKKTLKRLLSYMKPYRFQLILVFICIAISAFASVMSSLFLQRLIDDYIAPLLLEAAPVFTGLFFALCQMAVIYIIGAFATLFYNRIMAVISQGTLKTIRDDMFAHMQTLPLKYFDTHTHGDVMSHYTNDTDTLRQMISQSIPQTISSLFSVVAVFFSMLSLSVWLTIFVVVFLLLMFKVIGKVTAKSGRYFVRQQQSLGNVNGYVEEMINGQKVVKVFCHEDKTKQAFDERNEDLFENAAEANKFANILGPIMNALGYALYVLIAVLGGLMALFSTPNLTLTGMDEENLIVSMFADYIGVPKSVTKINRTEYNNVYENKGIDSIVSPKLLTTNEIIRYVRAMDDTTGGSVVTLYRIVDGKAEALEFSIKNDAPYNNIPLHKLRLKPNILIASIIRARKVIIPSGNDEIRKGDTVIIVTTTDHAIAELRDIFIRDDA